MPTPMQAAIMSSGSAAAYVDMWFAANTYRVAGVTSGDLPLVSGFSFTGASLRTMFDSTGKLTYGPNNLLLQSQTFGTGWTLNFAAVGSDVTTAPDGTATADRLLADAGNTTHYIFQEQTGTAGTSIFSCYAKYVSNQWFTVRLYDGATSYFATFDLLNGVVGTTSGATNSISSVGNGWYRLVMVATMAAGTGDILLALNNENTASLVSWNAAGTEAAYVWGAQLEAVTYRTTPAAYMPTTSAAYYGPRLVYDPVTLASLGILVEEARTNLCLQSNTFNTTWSATNLTFTAAATTGPDGTASGWKIQNTATAATSLGQSAVIVGTTATGSVYLKQGTSATNVFFLRNTTTATNIISTTVTWATLSVSGTGWTLTAVGGGWYRLVGIGATGITSGDTILFYVAHAGGSATAGEYFYGYGAQLEVGQGASSYIPTTTAAVTRPADSVGITGISLASAFTLVSEANAGVVSGTFRVATCSDGSTNNRLGNFVAASTALRCVATVAASGATAESGARAAGVAFKQASKFDGVSTFATSGNGAAVVSGTNALNVAVLTTLNIGGLVGIPESVNSTISRIRIYNRALSDAQLQALTA